MCFKRWIEDYRNRKEHKEYQDVLTIALQRLYSHCIDDCTSNDCFNGCPIHIMIWNTREEWERVYYEI